MQRMPASALQLLHLLPALLGENAVIALQSLASNTQDCLKTQSIRVRFFFKPQNHRVHPAIVIKLQGRLRWAT